MLVRADDRLVEASDGLGEVIDGSVDANGGIVEASVTGSCKKLSPPFMKLKCSGHGLSCSWRRLTG
jgi:hypothetical protein